MINKLERILMKMFMVENGVGVPFGTFTVLNKWTLTLLFFPLLFFLLALQHKRTTDFRMAALSAEATSSVVNLLAVLCGRRGRPM